MIKHKKKAIAAILTTVLSSVLGINMITGQNNGNIIRQPIPTVTENHQIVILFGKTYNLEDGQKIEITIDKFNRKRVIFTPGGNHDR